jgi:large subunit ribosomal protein L21
VLYKHPAPTVLKSEALLCNKTDGINFKLSGCQTRPSVEFWAAFSPRETMAYAIIRTGGRQFRVAEGDTLDVDLLDVEPGKTATFGDVLLFADGKDVTHGNPLISGAKVTAEVVEQRKDKKVVAFKYKRRKGYHRTVGHRRKLTRVKIKSISVGAKKSGTKKGEE